MKAWAKTVSVDKKKREENRSYTGVNRQTRDQCDTQGWYPPEDTSLFSPDFLPRNSLTRPSQITYVNLRRSFESLKVQFSDHILAQFQIRHSQFNNDKLLHHQQHIRLSFMRNSWFFITHFLTLSLLLRGLKKVNINKKLDIMFTFYLILTYPNSTCSPTIETNTFKHRDKDQGIPSQVSTPRAQLRETGSTEGTVRLIIGFIAIKIPFLAHFFRRCWLPRMLKSNLCSLQMFSQQKGLVLQNLSSRRLGYQIPTFKFLLVLWNTLDS